MKQPEVTVCVLEAANLGFCLNGMFQAKGLEVEGVQTALCKDGGVEWNGHIYQELTLIPSDDNCTFSIDNVVIGINFHWQRNETQTFKGKLKLIVNDAKICAINILPVEDYLVSVISSEMSATSALEFLKAHAVISRSWLLAQINKRKCMGNKDKDNSFHAFHKSDNMIVRWYDRQDHQLFDVCADDHCQRYQGITRATNSAVEEAVALTRGQVLKYDNEICDARFAKCCGGMMEKFSTCWEDTDLPYLQVKKDLLDATDDSSMPNLTIEQNAAEWIESSPAAFCNTHDKRILAQVLNNYDQETTDFYRWEVEYSQEEIRKLIEKKLKISLGDIIDIVPLKRGGSGRICLMNIVGSEKTITIGKELEIRRVLSDTHLYSSAFTVKKDFDSSDQSVPCKFVLRGAGWGHGVGLCQIGAAVMGDKGYDYQQILMHYYPTANIDVLY